LAVDFATKEKMPHRVREMASGLELDSFLDVFRKVAHDRYTFTTTDLTTLFSNIDL